MKRTFSKEEIEMAIKEMQIKSITVRMATIKNTNNNKYW
jgi:hypothetical protein